MTLPSLVLIFCLNSLALCANLANNIFNAINENRRIQKKTSLKSIANLESAAKDQALYMCENSLLTHDNSIGCLEKRVKRNGFRGDIFGENIAISNSDNIKHVVSKWMDSEEHRKNILGDYAYTGLATCLDKHGSRFWVQVFGNEGVEKSNDDADSYIIDESSNGNEKEDDQDKKLIVRYYIKQNPNKKNKTFTPAKVIYYDNKQAPDKKNIPESTPLPNYTDDDGYISEEPKEGNLLESAKPTVIQQQSETLAVGDTPKENTKPKDNDKNMVIATNRGKDNNEQQNNQKLESEPITAKKADQRLRAPQKVDVTQTTNVIPDSTKQGALVDDPGYSREEPQKKKGVQRKHKGEDEKQNAPPADQRDATGKLKNSSTPQKTPLSNSSKQHTLSDDQGYVSDEPTKDTQRRQSVIDNPRQNQLSDDQDIASDDLEANNEPEKHIAMPNYRISNKNRRESMTKSRTPKRKPSQKRSSSVRGNNSGVPIDDQHSLRDDTTNTENSAEIDTPTHFSMPKSRNKRSILPNDYALFNPRNRVLPNKNSDNSTQIIYILADSRGIPTATIKNGTVSTNPFYFPNTDFDVTNYIAKQQIRPQLNNILPSNIIPETKSNNGKAPSFNQVVSKNSQTEIIYEQEHPNENELFKIFVANKGPTAMKQSKAKAIEPITVTVTATRTDTKSKEEQKKSSSNEKTLSSFSTEKLLSVTASNTQKQLIQDSKENNKSKSTSVFSLTYSEASSQKDMGPAINMSKTTTYTNIITSTSTFIRSQIAKTNAGNGNKPTTSTYVTTTTVTVTRDSPESLHPDIAGNERPTIDFVGPKSTAASVPAVVPLHDVYESLNLAENYSPITSKEDFSVYRPKTNAQHTKPNLRIHTSVVTVTSTCTDNAHEEEPEDITLVSTFTQTVSTSPTYNKSNVITPSRLTNHPKSRNKGPPINNNSTRKNSIEPTRSNVKPRKKSIPPSRKAKKLRNRGDESRRKETSKTTVPENSDEAEEEMTNNSPAHIIPNDPKKGNFSTDDDEDDVNKTAPIESIEEKEDEKEVKETAPKKNKKPKKKKSPVKGTENNVEKSSSESNDDNGLNRDFDITIKVTRKKKEKKIKKS